MIKTMIVEDEKLAREELKYLINKEDDFKVVFEAGDGQKALDILT
ncbi:MULTISPECIES: response regulator [Halanaerobium]|uniref:Stage 0 sporulation protein A homolog n=1 Tax=Halanaerobium saccharolyticum TaxID=43595 RepID=A0A4R6RF18_9FIRM|nr:MULTISPECIES: response regulator [Halanaerobium]PUU91187.1 MAG: Autolysis response regulater LytR [Halanaerobium sp.]TDP84879.1 response regulator receiver domain-containing protein [Halanaerobium saccharolyticum]